MNFLIIRGIILILFTLHLFGHALPQTPLFHRVYKALFPSHSPPIEAFLNTPKLIEHYGYTQESHDVITEDGYILKLFRIPHGSKNQTGRGPVIIQHGFICSSDDWLALEKPDILPFLLADEGYDVWLGNARGNSYSNKHLIYNNTDLEFWNFSHDEMGLYDVPAIMKHILKVTGSEQLNYVGHSMGTTMFFVAMDKYPQLQPKVKRMVAMAPAVYATHVKTPLKFLADFSSETLMNFTDSHFHGRAVPTNVNKLLRATGPFLCIFRKGSSFCKNVVSLFGGFNKRHTSARTASILVGHTPSGASAKTMVHYFQYAKTPRFQRFDYGKRLNVKHYGSSQPPVYNLTNVKVPMMVMYGNNDWIIVPEDAERTIRELGNVMKAVRVEDPLFTHTDYTYANNAKKLVYEQCIDFLNS